MKKEEGEKQGALTTIDENEQRTKERNTGNCW